MKHIIILFIIGFCCQANAQNVLTLEEAKEITLSNNYGIQIAKNDVEIAKNLTDKRANGYLPNVAADGGLNGNVGTATQTFSNGMEAGTKNAFNWGANASVGANYTILDKRRDLTLDQLKESVELSSLQLLLTMEQNVLAVYNSYFQVAQLTENIKFLTEAISISKERLRRAETNLEFGRGNGLTVLNAEVDIQRDSVNMLNAQMNLDNAKRNLNVAMGRNSDVPFEVSPDIPVAETLALEALIEKAKEDNTAQQINLQALTINEMNLDIIDAEKKPSITAGANYGLNYSDNATGSFIDQSSTRGLNGNVGVSWTLFDGSRNVRTQNALLNIQNQKLQIQNLEQQLERDVRNAWANYQNALFVLEVEKNALDTNQENFNRTEEQVRAGQLSSIEFRQAQLNLFNAQVSLTNARFSAKQREIELMQLAGRLVE